MKIKRLDEQPKEFKPVTVAITFESLLELEAFLAHLNVPFTEVRNWVFDDISRDSVGVGIQETFMFVNDIRKELSK